MHGDVMLSEQQEPKKAKEETVKERGGKTTAKQHHRRKVISMTVISTTDTRIAKIKMMNQKSIQHQNKKKGPKRMTMGNWGHGEEEVQK